MARACQHCHRYDHHEPTCPEMFFRTSADGRPGLPRGVVPPGVLPPLGRLQLPIRRLDGSNRAVPPDAPEIQRAAR